MHSVPSSPLGAFFPKSVVGECCTGLFSGELQKTAASTVPIIVSQNVEIVKPMKENAVAIPTISNLFTASTSISNEACEFLFDFFLQDYECLVFMDGF